MSERAVENVWDYPRPPRLEPVEDRVRVEHAGIVIADSTRALRILETSHPPTYYIPSGDIDFSVLQEASARSTFCEWKGQARYWDLVMDGERRGAVAWDYPEPSERYAALAEHLAFYASRVDACYVGEERVQAQEGDFYGGWITSWIRGGSRGIKGGPGTWGW